MTKVDIFSGFLGAGKTTLIKKLIAEAYQGEKLVLIENEFGEIGIDGGFLQDAGIEITEMNSGCICCSLVGDFGEALEKVLDQFNPDRILIEPSGVGKLSDVISAVEGIHSDRAVVNCRTTVADAGKCRLYMKNFGEFYDNQIASATTIVLSRTAGMKQEKLDTALALLREKNPNATIITTPWDQLDGKQILEAMEQNVTLATTLADLEEEHHHHDHEHEHEHEHAHEHEHEHEHEHAHEHEHEHEHEHHHHHHDHDHHHADEVFTSWGVESAKPFTPEEIEADLKALDDEAAYGIVLRAKGIVPGKDGQWIYFDHVPGEIDIRTGSPAVTGRLCVIGSQIHEDALKTLFGV